MYKQGKPGNILYSAVGGGGHYYELASCFNELVSRNYELASRFNELVSRYLPWSPL